MVGINKLYWFTAGCTIINYDVVNYLGYNLGYNRLQCGITNNELF